ncbi:MAG: methionyl-tRNA formyltransferase [Actinomycetota bacterium]
MRLVFFGTPPAAVASLDSLVKAGHEVLSVVTAPDRPRGRGMNVSTSAVSSAAQRLGLEVLKPTTLKGWSFDREADVFVVVAYGLLLPTAVLESTSNGCLNVHFSLLPKFRGAAPVQWALIEGETLTGVTIMQLDKGLDTGPILAQSEEVISATDTAGEIESRLAERGAKLLIEVLESVQRGEAVPRPQDDHLATLAPKLTKQDARIDWSRGASDVVNRIRAFNPRPGAWALINSKRVRILRAREIDEVSTQPHGTIDLSNAATLLVSTDTHQVEIEELQPEGGSPMSAADFVRGYRPEKGDRFL